MKRIDPSSARPAFTLVELLAVMGIIVILMTLLVPAAATILRGTQVTASGQEIAASFALARQTALAQNRSVEIRFYKYADPSVAGNQAAYRAFQLFVFDEAGTKAKPIGKVQLLPVTIVLEPDPLYSTLLSVSETSTDKVFSTSTSDDPQVSIPRVKVNYTAKVVRYRPDGSTTLDQQKPWFLTLRAQTDLAKPPKNFVAIQVDPVSGSIKSYHP